MPFRSEREKMLAGESYDIFDPELVARRQRVKELLRRFNREEAEPRRLSLLQQLLGEVGRESIIEPPFYCSYGENTYLGDHVFLNSLCTILDNNEVRIGNHVMLGPVVQIYTAIHPLQAAVRNQGWETTKPVTVEEGVWVAGGAILLPGVTIGRHAVVGAGAVVVESVPANTVVAGNPARVIREIE
jgi:maltose O-acetyltransferase